MRKVLIVDDESSIRFVLARTCERAGVPWEEAGSAEEAAPVSLDAAIIFAPVGALVERGTTGVGRHVEVNDAAAIMSQHQEDVQDLEPNSWKGEEVQ